MRELQLREKIDDKLCELFSKYRVKRAEKLGIESTKHLFYVSAIICTRIEDGTFYLHRLETNPLPNVDLIEDYDYDAIGTGELYAKLLMRQHNRSHPSGLSAITINNNKFSAVLTINEIKTFDTYSGGSTQLGLLDKDDFRIWSNKEVRDYYNDERHRIAKDTEEKQKQYGVTYEMVLSHFPDM